jgi:hypothetical protein
VLRALSVASIAHTVSIVHTCVLRSQRLLLLPVLSVHACMGTTSLYTLFACIGTHCLQILYYVILHFTVIFCILRFVLLCTTAPQRMRYDSMYSYSGSTCDTFMPFSWPRLASASAISLPKKPPPITVTCLSHEQQQWQQYRT